MNKRSGILTPLHSFQYFKILCCAAGSLLLWILPIGVLSLLRLVPAATTIDPSAYGSLIPAIFVTWIMMGAVFGLFKITLIGLAASAHFSYDREKERAGTPVVEAFLESEWFRDPFDYFVGAPIGVWKVIRNGG